MRIASLTLLALCLAVIPAVAQTDIYDNGPINGTVDAWTINSGFAVSDSFTLGAAANVSGLNFAVWILPGDVLESAEVSITSGEFGGTSFFDQSVTSPLAVAPLTSLATMSALNLPVSPVRALMPAPIG